MRFEDRIKNLTEIYPHLSRVWINTGDPKLPLKGVWIDESRLNRVADEDGASPRESETTELAEDHLLAA
jgi:hypothetical protein